jgi:hypothetical protein
MLENTEGPIKKSNCDYHVDIYVTNNLHTTKTLSSRKYMVRKFTWLQDTVIS